MRYELRVEVPLGWGIVKSLSALILGRISQIYVYIQVLTLISIRLISVSTNIYVSLSL